MSALTIAETEALRQVATLISFIERSGYNPAEVENSVEEKRKSLLIKNAKSKLNMVIQMKGYYPS